MSTEVYRLIDSHVHLDEIENVERAIREAKQVGVVALIAVGQDYESNLKVLDLSEKYRGFVYPALGLHPWNLGNMGAAEVALNLKLIEENIERIVGIGEVGLDYHKRVKAKADKGQQKEAFEAVLELAKRYDKPVSVHSRYAWKDCFDLVKASGVNKAVFHWYTGFSSVLREIIDEGYYISATPAGEYHDEHRRAIKEVPLENLLLETDSPVSYGREIRYQARPADVVRSLGAVAQLRGLEKRVIAEQTTENAIRLFGLAEQATVTRSLKGKAELMRNKESNAQAAKPVFRDAPQQWEEIIAKWIWPESSVASLVQRYRWETANMAISEFADWVMGQMARTRDIENNVSLELATIDWLYDFVRANVMRGRVFDLGEVLSQGSADCIGYAKLFTLLARRFGLDTGIIEVLADNADRHLPHAINLVRLSNKERRFVDLWYGSKNINHQRVAIQVREEGIWRKKDVDRDELSILEDIKALPDECADAITLYIQGNRCLNEGEYDSAIKYYSEAIRIYPTNARFYFNRAVAYDNKGEPENAEVDYAQALKDNDSLIRVLAREHEEVIQLIELDAKQISPRDQQIYLFHKGFLTGEQVPLDQVAREFYMSEDEVRAALSCCEAP